MLYLIRPDHSLLRSNPMRQVVRLMREAGRDLVELDWTPDTRRANETTLRPALRKGIATSIGIAFDDGLLVVQDRPGLLRQTAADSAAAHARLPIQHPELDARVAEQDGRNIAEAEGRLQAELNKTPDQTLVTCWEDLGGRLPSPL